MINRSVGRVDMQGFQTKALVVTLIGGDNFRLYSWLDMCAPIKLNFHLLKEGPFLMLFQTCTN